MYVNFFTFKLGIKLSGFVCFCYNRIFSMCFSKGYYNHKILENKTVYLSFLINLYTAFQYAALSCLPRLCYSHFKFRITAKGVIDPISICLLFHELLQFRRIYFSLMLKKHNKVTAGRL